MEAVDVLHAIKALENACRVLRSGSASVTEQMQIASDCSLAEIRLTRALETACPEIKVEA